MQNRYLIKDSFGNFSKFSYVRQLTSDELFHIIFDDNSEIYCSKYHSFYLDHSIPIFAFNIVKNDNILSVDNKFKRVKDIQLLVKKSHIYDPINVENDNHSYITNNIASHNCFLGSSYTLINAEVLAQIKSEYMMISHLNKQHWQEFPIYEWKAQIYRPAVKGNCYIMGVDVADGVGIDYSVIKVFDITNAFEIEEVAHFSDNLIKTIDLPIIIAKLGKMYNFCPVAVESNAIGRAVLDHLLYTFEYENIIHHGGKGVGVLSNGNTKRISILNFKNIVENKHIKIKIRSSNFYEQLETFGKDGEYYKGLDHSHDDEIFSAVWSFLIFEPKIMCSYFDCELKPVSEIFNWYIHMKMGYTVSEELANKNIDEEYQRLKHYERDMRLSGVKDAMQELGTFQRATSFNSTKNKKPNYTLKDNFEPELIVDNEIQRDEQPDLSKFDKLENGLVAGNQAIKKEN